MKLPHGLVAEELEPAGEVRLAAGERRASPCRLRCVHWGTYDVGEVLWRVRDAYGLPCSRAPRASLAD